MTEDTTDREAWTAFVRALRARRHWSQSHLGRLLHVTDSAVRNWERGLSTPLRWCRQRLLEVDREYPGDPNDDLADTKSA